MSIRYSRPGHLLLSVTRQQEQYTTNKPQIWRFYTCTNQEDSNHPGSTSFGGLIHIWWSNTKCKYAKYYHPKGCRSQLSRSCNKARVWCSAFRTLVFLSYKVEISEHGHMARSKFTKGCRNSLHTSKSSAEDRLFVEGNYLRSFVSLPRRASNLEMKEREEKERLWWKEPRSTV